MVNVIVGRGIGLRRHLGMSKLAEENYNRMRNRLMDSIKVRCSKCKGVMIQVYDLWDQTVVGYSCKDCTHYYLFDNNPV